MGQSYYTLFCLWPGQGTGWAVSVSLSCGHHPACLCHRLAVSCVVVLFLPVCGHEHIMTTSLVLLPTSWVPSLQDLMKAMDPQNSAHKFSLTACSRGFIE